MRTDENTGLNPHCAPNSFTDKYDRSFAETTYPVSSNVASQQSHFWSESNPERGYGQARHLYRDMDERDRLAVRSNTAGVLKLVENPKIIENYLGQLLAIDEIYAHGVWEKLPEGGRISWSSVKNVGKTAAIEGKDKRLRPHAEEDKLVGTALRVPFYD